MSELSFQKELEKRGLVVSNRKEFPFRFDLSVIHEQKSRLDLIVEDLERSGHNVDYILRDTMERMGSASETVTVYRRVFRGTLQQAWDFLKDFEGSGGSK